MEGQFRSLIDIFKTGKEQYPDKTAIIMGEDTRTYGDIFDNAKKIAGFVLKKGIKPQDKVAFISQNHVDYIETVLGILMTGAVPVNINWRLAAPELHHLLQFNEVKLTFFRSKDETIRAEMGELTKELCQCIDASAYQRYYRYAKDCPVYKRTIYVGADYLCTFSWL